MMGLRRALPTALFMLQLTWSLLVFALGLFGVSSSLVMCERIAMTGADDAHESCVTVAVNSHEMCLCSFNDGSHFFPNDVALSQWTGGLVIDG